MELSLLRAITWLVLEQNSIRRSLAVGSALAFLEILILVAAASVDGNFWLPEQGIGLLQHPGIWVIVLADFVVLVLAAATVQRFLLLARKLPVDSQKSTRRYLRSAVSRGRAAILLQQPGNALFFFCAGVGIIFWTWNAIQTLDPVTYYRNDVYDSFNYPYSYVAFRSVLAISWIVIYPFCAVVIFAVAGNIFAVTRTLGRRRRLGYKTFHPDRSGGFSFVGDISFLAIMAMLTLYAALITVVTTHRTLSLLQISGFVILSVFFIGMSYLISWPTIIFLIRKKREMLTKGYKFAHRASAAGIANIIWLSSISSFSPYSAYQRVLINLARAIPVLVAVYRLST